MLNRWNFLKTGFYEGIIFGFDRLMFGSDWPVCLLASSYDDVVGAALEAVGEISADDMAKFMGSNATEFYGLDVP